MHHLSIIAALIISLLLGAAFASLATNMISPHPAPFDEAAAALPETFWRLLLAESSEGGGKVGHRSGAIGGAAVQIPD